MYEQYFGLSRKPFNATPDPWFHYTNRAYQEAYATLLYGIQERKGFIALIGEVGTGKTTLLRRLMDNMNPVIKAVFVHNTMLTFDELVEFICAELEISVSGVARLARLQALNRFLVAEAKSGGTVVLLLDEAQNLSAEALENLRLISNLETSTDKLLQIVLAGQPELDTKLADPALRQLTQRIALRFRLEPLDDSEVEPYIDYRLRVVGRSRRDLFTDKAIRKLIPYVHGIPRLINVICDNALVLAYATDRQRVTGQMIESVVTDLRLKPPLAAGRSAPASAPARPERDLAALWKGESSAADGRRWAAAGFAAGCALALFGVVAVGLGGSLDLGGRLSSMGVLADRILATGRQPSGASGPASTAPVPTPPTESAPEGPPVPAPPAGLTTSVNRENSSGVSSGPESSRAEPAVAPVIEPPAPSPVGPEKGDRGLPSAGIAKIAGRAVTVPRGGTISAIVFDHYGRYSSLALDLIQELNPDIDDLDIVAAGQPLWLPPLNLDALLRRQADGSYRLVVNSQPTIAAATKVAEAVREHGYTAAVTTRTVASEHVLYRVEIRALKTRAAAIRAWETARRLEWFEPEASDVRSRPARTGLSFNLRQR
jgi:general secretion pathway protein A